QPLTTPEARAGLRQRLIDHSRAIGDPALARLYRAHWLDRFVQLIAPNRTTAPFAARGRLARRPVKAKRPPPSSLAPEDRFYQAWSLQDRTRRLSSSGIDRPLGLDLLVGLVEHPEVLAEVWERLAELPVPTPEAEELRNELLAAASTGSTLDQETVATILGLDGAAGGKALRVMGFSFTRRDSDPERARSDLAAAVEISAATEEVDRALEDATERDRKSVV